MKTVLTNIYDAKNDKGEICKFYEIDDLHVVNSDNNLVYQIIPVNETKNIEVIDIFIDKEKEIAFNYAEDGDFKSYCLQNNMIPETVEAENGYDWLDTVYFEDGTEIECAHALMAFFDRNNIDYVVTGLSGFTIFRK